MNTAPFRDLCNIPDSGNDKKWDYHEQMAKYQMDDSEISQKKEMTRLLMNAIDDYNAGKVAPDTIGADYFFLDQFMTYEMEYDFVAIEMDFLEHCRERLDEFNKVGWYGDEEHINYGPGLSVKKRIMRLIYNGAKLRDEYCLALIKYLYKLYHKKEYNRIKRFSRISAREILDVVNDSEDGSLDSAIGRVLGMCHFMNIKEDEMCIILYHALNEHRITWLQYIDDDDIGIDVLNLDKELIKECSAQIDKWYNDCLLEDKHRNGLEAYFEVDDFVEMCLQRSGYKSDYAYLCNEIGYNAKTEMRDALMLLKTRNPEREYTYEEVQHYAAVYNLVEALTDAADVLEEQVAYLTGEDSAEDMIDDALFDAKNIVLHGQTKKKHGEQNVITNIAPVSTGDVCSEEYLKEIADLRRKLNEKEQENKALVQQCRQLKKEQLQSESLISKYESERDELIALRNFVYRLENSTLDDDTEGISLDEMKDALVEKHIVIIGGHVTWVNKLKKLFPEWKYIDTNAYKTVDGKMLDGKDMVYFFTDYMNHISYTKFIAAVRERKIPFGYLAGTNIENTVRQIYDSAL